MKSRSNVNSMSMVRRVFVMVLLLSVCTTTLLAQMETTTRITGLVTDPSGAAVSGVTVTVKNQDTGATRRAVTDAGGFYSFSSLQPGVYTITASRPSFRTNVVTDRRVLVAQPAHVDIRLELGEITQSVTVTAAGAELLTTGTAEIAETITSALVENVPIPRDNMFALAELVPGASPQNLVTTGTSFAAQSMATVNAAGDTLIATGISLHGQRDNAANVSVDGANIQSSVYQQTTQLQASSTIYEMKIQGGNMNAEFGSGVTAVNIVTKSGTNNYHGQLYESLRNNHLDANPFFSNRLGRKLPTYQQNLFGLAVGGPIKRDKLLFFGNYQGHRVRQRTTLTEKVPPLATLNGDFSGLATIYDPYAYDPQTGLRVPFAGNQIPLTRADPVTLAFSQKWMVPPNATLTGTPVLVGDASTYIDSDQMSVRMDYYRSANTTLYGRWTRLVTTQEAKGIQPLEGHSNPFGSGNGVIHWTQILRTTAVNDLLVAYTRPTWSDGPNLSVRDVGKSIGLANSGAIGFPAFLNTGYVMGADSSLGGSGTELDDARENNYQLKDDFTYSSRRHTVKLGAEIRERRFYYMVDRSSNGMFTFGAIWSAACAAGNTKCAAARNAGGLSAGGSALADFLLGTAVSINQEGNAAPYAGYQRYYGAYLQDSWRTTDKLTLNIGVRYEYWSPWRVPRNTVGRLNFDTGQLEYALKNPLDYLSATACYGRCGMLTPGVPREIYATGNLNLAPRVGLAYRVTKSMVLRAGAGIYYGGNVDNNAVSAMTSSLPPFGLSSNQLAVASDQLPSVFVNGSFPPPPPTGVPQPNATPVASFRSTLPYIAIPTTYQWSTSVQRGIGSYWTVELQYVGSHSIHQTQLMDLNSARLPQGADAALSLQQRRRLPQWGRINSYTRLGWYKYNAGSIAVRNRPWHGLSLLAPFTWAKNLGTSDMIASDGGITNLNAPYILAGDVTLTSRLRFGVSVNYDLPFGQGKALALSSRSIAGILAGGWTVSGYVSFTTGSPQPVRAVTDLTGVALQYAYPNRICDPSDVPGGRSYAKWFNTSCFASAPYGTWPNSPLGAVTFPGINNWEWAFSKTIPTKFLNESGQITFRAELFNAFNHTQWGSPGNRFGASGFGQIYGTRPARKIQLSLRYRF